MKALVYGGPGEKSWTDKADPVVADPRDAINFGSGWFPTLRKRPGKSGYNTIAGALTEHFDRAGPWSAEELTELNAGTIARVLGQDPDHELMALFARSLNDLGRRITTEHDGRFRAVIDAANGSAPALARHLGAWSCFADTSTYKLPEAVSDEAALLLADILPTSYEVGVLNGAVRPGDSVAVVGTGPIGLAAIATAKLLSPSQIIAIDKAPARLQAAKDFGADLTLEPGDACAEQVIAATDALGADVVIEAVGTPATFELCTRLVRPGGHVANVGVHGAPATLHLESLWIKDVTITTGLVDTSSTPTLLRMLAAGRFDTGAFITHRFGLDEMQEAYDVFSRPADTGALKVALLRH